MKTTSIKFTVPAAGILSLAIAVAAYAQDANRGHGRGHGPGSQPTPGASPSFTPPGHHYGWDKGRGNPHHSPSPTATPTSPTPTPVPGTPTPTPVPATPTPTP